MRAIDADALGNRMYHEVFEKDSEDQRWDSGCWMRYKLFERVLRDAPTIEPERKKGKWIKQGHWGRVYKCNQCGNFLDFDGVNVGRGDANFCPNCGADMRENHLSKSQYKRIKIQQEAKRE